MVILSQIWGTNINHLPANLRHIKQNSVSF
jgi:hypothetical protein